MNAPTRIDPQPFTAPDGTEMIIITRERYEQLLEAEEDADDLAAAYAARRESETDGTIPAEVSQAVRAGKNPVAAWRSHRRMTQADLAEKVGVTQPAIARIEAGPAGSGRDDTLARIAHELGAPLAHVNPPAITPEDRMRKALANAGDPKTGRLVMRRN